MVLELHRADISHNTVNVLNAAELYTFKWWIKQKRSRVDQPGVSGCLSLPRLPQGTPLPRPLMFHTEQWLGALKGGATMTSVPLCPVLWWGRGRGCLSLCILHFSGSAHQNLARLLLQVAMTSAQGVRIFMTAHVVCVYCVSALFAFVLITKSSF